MRALHPFRLVLSLALCCGLAAPTARSALRPRGGINLSPWVDAALSARASKSWSGEGAYGSVTPLGPVVSASTGHACEQVSCSDPCQSYLVIYETAETKAKYKGYACETSAGWKPLNPETLIGQVEQKSTSTSTSPTADQKRQALAMLQTLRYAPPGAVANADASKALENFFADEQPSRPDKPEDVLALLNEAVARSRHAGCPKAALDQIRPNRACLIVR